MHHLINPWTKCKNFKAEITGQTEDNGRIDNVELMVPLKYLGNFWRTLEMPLINCEVNLILDWSSNYDMIYTDVEDQAPTFKIIETTLYVPAVNLSTLSTNLMYVNDGGRVLPMNML